MADPEDSYWDIFEEKTPTARKSHRCGECRREIEVGERYSVGGGLIHGRWQTHKMCLQCRAAARWLEVVCNGWLYTYVLEDLREHLNEVETQNDWTLLVLIVAGSRGWKNIPESAVRYWVSTSLDLYRRNLREIG